MEKLSVVLTVNLSITQVSSLSTFPFLPLEKEKPDTQVNLSNINA